VAAAAEAAMGSPGGAVIGTSAALREDEIRQFGADRARTVDTPCLACHVALVRVDPESGLIDVERYFAAHDVGRALNPLACRGQIEGGVLFGLGFALTEDLIQRDGANVNANLWEYLLPTAPHVPDMTVEMVEMHSTYGPFGAKGIGESPCIAVGAAVANAVEDAVGVRIRHAPLTPERVVGAVRERGGAGSSPRSNPTPSAPRDRMRQRLGRMQTKSPVVSTGDFVRCAPLPCGAPGELAHCEDLEIIEAHVRGFVPPRRVTHSPVNGLNAVQAGLLGEVLAVC